MPITWNESAKAKLFTGVLLTTGVKLDYGKLAEFMGDGCTAKAITHVIARIKAEGKDSSNAASAETPPSTTSKGKRKKIMEEEGDVGDEQEDSPTKPKKVRTPRKPRVAKKKATPEQVDSAVAGENDDESGTNGVKSEGEDEG